MKRENDQEQEGRINAGQEMEWALEAARTKDWSELGDNLNQFDVKGSEGGLTEENKGMAREQLAEIRKLVENASDMDEKQTFIVQEMLERAEKRLAE